MTWTVAPGLYLQRLQGAGHDRLQSHDDPPPNAHRESYYSDGDSRVSFQKDAAFAPVPQMRGLFSRPVLSIVAVMTSTGDQTIPLASRFTLFLTPFFCGVVWTTLGPLLDSILRDLGIPLSRGGLPAVVFFLGCLLGIVCLNTFLAGIPVKRCLVVASLLEAAGLAVTGLLSRGLWSFLVAFFSVGLFMSVGSAVPGMWLSAHLREKSAWALNVMMACSVLGMMMAPLVLGVLLGRGVTWRWIFAGEAVCLVAFAVILAALPLADIPDRENLRLRQLREVASSRPRLLAVMLTGAFFYLSAETILVVWLPKFELDVFGASETWAALAVTFYFFGQVVGRVAAIGPTRRFKPSVLLLVLTLSMAVFVGAVALSPVEAASLALTFMTGFASSASYSLVASYAGRFPRWHAGVVFSAFQVAGGIGSIVFPYVAGPVAAEFGLRAAIGLAAGPLLIVAALAVFLGKASEDSGRAPGPEGPRAIRS
jgi:MFS family permease